MAAAVRSASSTTYASRTNTTITAPAGIQNGDVLVLFLELYHASSPPTVTLPTGFTLLTGFPHTIIPAGAERMVARIAVKTASGESGNYTCTHTSASTQGSMLCVSGATITGAAATTNNGTGTTSTALTIDPAAADALIAYFAAAYDGITNTTPPTGTTPTFTEYLDGALTYLAAGTHAVDTATGNKSITPDGNNVWHAFLVCLEAAGSGGTTENLGTTSTSSATVVPSLTLSHALIATSTSAALVTPTSTLSHALGVASCAASAVNVTDTRAIAVTPTSSAFSAPNITTTLSQALLNTSTAGSGVTPDTTLSQALSAASSTADGTETTETYTQSPDAIGIVSGTTTPTTSLSHAIDPASSTFSGVTTEEQRSIEVTPTSAATGTTAIETALSHALLPVTTTLTTVNVSDSSGSFEDLGTTSSAFGASSLTTTLSGGINAVSIVLSVVNPNVNLSHSITPPQGTFGTSTLGSSLSQEVGTATAVMSVPAIITTLEHSLSPTVATFTAVGTTEETSNSISLTPVSTSSGTSSFETRLAALIGIATATFTAGPISAIGVPIPIPPIDDIELDFDFVDEISIDFEFTENITLNFDFTDNIRLDF